MNLANKITIARILLIPIFILLFPIYPSWLIQKSAIIQHIDIYGIYYALAVFIIASATDKLDGYIARKHNLVTIITGIRIVASSQKIALQADQYGKFKMVLQVAGISAVLLNNGPMRFAKEFPADQILMYAALILTIYSGLSYIKNNYQTLKLNS